MIDDHDNGSQRKNIHDEHSHLDWILSLHLIYFLDLQLSRAWSFSFMALPLLFEIIIFSSNCFWESVRQLLEGYGWLQTFYPKENTGMTIHCWHHSRYYTWMRSDCSFRCSDSSLHHHDRRHCHRSNPSLPRWRSLECVNIQYVTIPSYYKGESGLSLSFEGSQDGPAEKSSVSRVVIFRSLY